MHVRGRILHIFLLLLTLGCTACGSEEYDPDQVRSFDNYPAIQKLAPLDVPFAGEQIGASIAHPDAFGLVWLDDAANTVSIVHAQWGYGWQSDTLEPPLNAASVESADAIMGPEDTAFIAIRTSDSLHLYEWTPTAGGTSTVRGERVPVRSPLPSWPESHDSVYVDALGDQVLVSFTRRENDDSGSVWMALRAGDSWSIEQVFEPRTSTDSELEANWDRRLRGIASRAALLPDGRPVVGAGTLRKDPEGAYCDQAENETTLTCQNLRNSCFDWGQPCEDSYDNDAVDFRYRMRVKAGTWAPVMVKSGPFGTDDERAYHDVMRDLDGVLWFSPTVRSSPRDLTKPVSFLAFDGARYAEWQDENLSLDLPSVTGRYIGTVDLMNYCGNSDITGGCLDGRAPIRSPRLRTPFARAHGTYAAYGVDGPLFPNDANNREARYTPPELVPERRDLHPPAGMLEAPIDAIELELTQRYRAVQVTCAPLGYDVRPRGTGGKIVFRSQSCGGDSCVRDRHRFERTADSDAMLPGTRYACWVMDPRRADGRWPGRWDFPPSGQPTVWEYSVRDPDPPVRPTPRAEIRYDACYAPEAGGTVRGTFGAGRVVDAELRLVHVPSGLAVESTAMVDTTPNASEYEAPEIATTNEWELRWDETLAYDSEYRVEIDAVDARTSRPILAEDLWFPTQGPRTTMSLQSPVDPDAMPVDAAIIVQFSAEEGFVLPKLIDASGDEVALSLAQLDARTFRFTPVELLEPDSDYAMIIDLTDITVDACVRHIEDGTSIELHTEAL